jgi:hypothetical protein
MKYSSVAAVLEIENAGVLEEAADDADHAHVSDRPRNPRPQPAGVAHDQVHLDAGLRGPVYSAAVMSLSSRAFILKLDQRRAVPRVRADLALDSGQQRRFQHLRRRQQLSIVALGHVAGGQVVEQLGEVAPISRIAGEQAQVGIQPGGAGVVVAGADVRVAAQAVVVAADHQDHLAVGLQAHHPVGDVDADFLQATTPSGCWPPRRSAPSARPPPSTCLPFLGRVDQHVDDLGVR